MSEPKIDPEWNSGDNLPYRPFLVIGIPLLVVVLALTFTFFKGCNELGKVGSQPVYDPVVAEGEGFPGRANVLLQHLLNDTLEDANFKASDLTTLNQRYRALTFALPYGEESKSVIEASDLRLVGIDVGRITDPEDRLFYFNSRLPQLLQQQKKELSETYFRIKARGLSFDRSSGVRPIAITSLEVIPSMFKVSLSKDPWTGVIRCAPNSLFMPNAAVYVGYGTSVLPLPRQQGRRPDLARTMAYRAVMSRSAFFENNGAEVDYYKHYQQLFSDGHQLNALKLELSQEMRSGASATITVACLGDTLYIVPSTTVRTFSPTGEMREIPANQHGAQAIHSVPVEEGLKLVAYDANNYKLGEFVIYQDDPSRNLSQLIQTNVGMKRYTLPSSRTDLFTQQLVRGLSRNLSTSTCIDTVQVSVDPLFSQAFERELQQYLLQVERNFPKYDNQQKQEYDISMTVMDLSTGEVIASPFYTTRFERSDYPDEMKMTVRNPALSRRFVGSTFKPMVALAAGLTNDNLLSLNTQQNRAYSSDGRTANFFGYEVRPWAKEALSHWGGSRFPCFITRSDDVFPVALAALAMSGQRVPAGVTRIPVSQDNGFFCVKNNQLFFKREGDADCHVDIHTHPFTKWISYLYAANVQEDYTSDTLLFKSLYEMRDANYALSHPGCTENPDDRKFGLESLCPDITNLRMDDFLQGGGIQQTLVPWILGQGNNQWSCIKLAEAWSRMLGKQDVQASFIARSGDVQTLASAQRDPALSMAGQEPITDEYINRTWNRFLELFSQAATDASGSHGHSHTFASMQTAVQKLNAASGRNFRLFAKTGTPDDYARYENTLLHGNRRQIDIGMFTFALIDEPQYQRIRNNQTGKGLVCVIRVTRTFECRQCSARHDGRLCQRCQDAKDLGSTHARDFITRGEILRKFYDMTRNYYD